MPRPSARRRPAPQIARRFGRTALAALVAGVLLAADHAGAGEAVAAQTPRIAEAAEVDAAAEGAPQLVVSPADAVLEEGADDYEFNVLVRNAGEEALPAGTVDIEIRPQRITGADELDAEFPDMVRRVGSVEIREIEAGEEQHLTLPVSREDLPLTISDPAGVYLMRATLSAASEGQDPGVTPAPGDDADEAAPEMLAQAVSPLVWRGPGTDDRLRLSSVVPFVLPEEVRTMPTRPQLEDLAPRLDSLLDAAIRERSTIALDPRIIAGVRAYGAEAPESATRLLERLRESRLPVFLLQFADADPAAQAALGLDELLQPENLDFVTRFGSFPAAESETGDGAGEGVDSGETGPDEETRSEGAGSEGTGSGERSREGSDGSESAGEADAPGADGEGTAEEPTDEGGESPDPDEALPSLEELLDWPTGTPTAWPAAGEVDDATLQLLRDSGTEAVVLSSENVTHAGGPRARVNGFDGLITDAVVDDAIRIAVEAPTEAEREAGLAEASARLALAAEERVPGLAVSIDRAAIAEAEDPALILTQLGSFDWVEPVAAADQSEGTASLKSGATLEDRRELLRSALGREQQVADLAPVLEEPSYLTGYQRARLLQLLSTRYADVDFSRVAERFGNRDDELLEGVRVISTEHTQLVGTSSHVPVQVRNSLPFDAIVTAEVAPASAAVTVQEPSVEATRVPADGSQTVLVPVHSRVSSGDSGLLISLADASGEHRFASALVPLSISSAVESIALWTLGGAAALLLGFGIWRSIRHRGRTGHTEEDPPSPEDPASPRDPATAAG
ncbi:hypothetical protein JD276_06685 [Leucobacter sp. CSA1]|uniref:Secreted protein n=1 Tax=Leucobacter chromiisoli TaxID=2796471 RepID=A0A934Q6Q2_9MICO|nr:DUF6049 family protein [Leucobacter chromiisoli]MBK0418721.1 hypothetical protein [Leucobacter chromiisoli]